MGQEWEKPQTPGAGWVGLSGCVWVPGGACSLCVTPPATQHGVEAAPRSSGVYGWRLRPCGQPSPELPRAGGALGRRSSGGAATPQVMLCIVSRCGSRPASVHGSKGDRPRALWPPLVRGFWRGETPAPALPTLPGRAPQCADQFREVDLSVHGPVLLVCPSGEPDLRVVLGTLQGRNPRGVEIRPGQRGDPQVRTPQ